MFSYYTTEMTETYRLGASKSFLHPWLRCLSIITLH